VGAKGPDVRAKAAFSLVAGALHLVLGALQLAAGLGLRGRWSEVLLLAGGVPAGLVLLLVGAVFLQGHRELSRDLREGVAFVYMGILIALFFTLLELAEIGASYLGALTLGGDYAGYSPLDTITPVLYLSPLTLAGLWTWRGGFTLTPRGVREGQGERVNNAKEV
jgi:hypothetical protein